MTTDGPVEVYAARDLAEAQFVHGILADAGIGATIVGESLGAAAGELPPLVATPRVWVRADDAERAWPLVEQYQRRLSERAAGRGTESRAEEPFCYHCGEPVGRGQSPCPTCGRELDWEQP
jgi:hypothetical protein